MTNSSGRLPSALWTNPIMPAPSWSPRASTLRPTRLARAASASPATTNAATSFAPARLSTAAATVSAAQIAISR